ncbi:hypothetical protein [Parafrankia discariae]|uniref:hypothetical protein n=1 Tax=Parafrankia discariae TaxID=365528 RepID=UPI0012B69272|nr:hypothetical protein [Parafrankia discariae]
MDDSSSDIETYLPNLSGFQLDEVAKAANSTLRRVARRVARDATLASLASFSSSNASFDEAGTPGSRIPPATPQPAEESAELQPWSAGFTSSIAPTF